MADTTPRTTFNSLLTSTILYLQAGYPLPADRFYRSMKKVGVKIGFQADQYIVLRPGGAQVDGLWADSEGRQATKIKRELIVEPYYRLSLDNSVSNDQITQALLATEDAIVDLLQIWQPDLALEPYHFLGIAPETAEEESARSWAWSSLRFSVVFLQALDQSRQ